MPATVRDAVVARVARLSPPARHALEAVALAGARAELRLLEDVLGDGFGALDEPLEHGVLRVQDGDVTFRHELARLAVAEQVPAGPPAVAAPAAAGRAAVVGRGRRRGGPGPAGPLGVAPQEAAAHRQPVAAGAGRMGTCAVPIRSRSSGPPSGRRCRRCPTAR